MHVKPVEVQSPLRPQQPSGQGTDSWLACHDYQHSTAEDPPCRGDQCTLNLSLHNAIPLSWCGSLEKEWQLSVGPPTNFKRNVCTVLSVPSPKNFVSRYFPVVEECFCSNVVKRYSTGRVGFVNSLTTDGSTSLLSWDLNKLPILLTEAFLNEAIQMRNADTFAKKNSLFGALYGLVKSFKNDEGHNVTVNGDRYRAMLTNFFVPELNNHDVQELWFQQDGATCHTARATIDLLKDTLGDRLISRFGPVNWPPRSCDLTSLDYFLWGNVKSLVYADKSQTLDHLEDNIRRVIADIRPQMLEKVIENWTSRLDYI
ncbi:DUF4817 domain-containing protein [Trichonephila clavipes]|nr:DUF4817 domain-containing protein [Trichonephila clavipes]